MSTTSKSVINISRRGLGSILPIWREGGREGGKERGRGREGGRGEGEKEERGRVYDDPYINYN